MNESVNGRDANSATTRRQGWLLAVVAILFIAAFLRLYQLDTVPPGLNFDEAGDAVAAVDILSGQPQLFWRIGGGKEPFWPYLLALAFWLGGRTPFVLRLSAALVGIATVGVTYAAVRAIFSAEGAWRARGLAALTALGLATAYWHVSFSRLGLRVITMPLFIVLCSYFLWKGLCQGKGRYFALSGLFLGGSLYTYTGARFWPLALLVFLALNWLLSRGQTPTKASTPPIRPFAILALSALAAASPLLVYFILNPADFVARAAVTSFLSPQVSHGSPWQTLFTATWQTLGAFGFTADANRLVNLPGRSIFSLPEAVLFWSGVAIALWRVRRPPYLFALSWWLVMLAPAIAAPEEVPHYLRTLGAAPIAYLFPALALVTLGEKARRILEARRTCQLVALAAVLLYGWAGWRTYHDYFQVWARDADALYLPFDLYAVELVEEMSAENDPGAVYILPGDIRAGGVHQHFTVDFLYHGATPYHYIKVDEGSIAADLTAYCRGKTTVHVINWKADKHQEADHKELLPFLLSRNGAFLRREAHRAYDTVTYRLSSGQTVFSLDADLRPVQFNFGGKLSLIGLAYGPTAESANADGSLASGGTAWVVLRWRKEGELAEDYKLSLRAVDEAGQLVGQKDRPLYHNWHMGTSGWAVGEEVNEFFLLPVWAATPPGEYQLQAVVYSPLTMERLPVAGGAAAALAEVAVGRPTQPVDKTTLPTLQCLDREFGGGLNLLGCAPSLPETVSPGGWLELALYWEAGQDLRRDYQIGFSLRNREGELALGRPRRPLGDGYPTDHWRVGDVWRGWQRLTVPATTPPGSYELVLRPEGENGEAVLGELKVEGRPRSFEVPPIDHPLNADLAGKVRLLGYDSNVGAAELKVTLYWQASAAEMDTSYTVFVHLVDEAGQVRAQRDSVPGGGALPTTGWLPGEVIADEYAIPLPPQMPPGEYTIVVGMYDAASGQRLPVLGSDGAIMSDHVLLPEKVKLGKQ
jgi:4-amino-4-deoxy-L-arabinose transferase-like glycosyltransferase